MTGETSRQLALSLRSKRCLVTGGGAGIGAACAIELAKREASVMVADLDLDAAVAVARSIGDAARAITLDVRDPEDVANAVQATSSVFGGGLDIAVNNAGVGVPDPRDTGETPIEEWRRVPSVNLDGVFHCMRSELTSMIANGAGSIITWVRLDPL